MDDDLSPTKLGRIDIIEPHRKIVQDTIQEESSELNSLNNKRVNKDEQRESREFVLQLAPTSEQRRQSGFDESTKIKFENE